MLVKMRTTYAIKIIVLLRMYVSDKIIKSLSYGVDKVDKKFVSIMCHFIINNKYYYIIHIMLSYYNNYYSLVTLL